MWQPARRPGDLTDAEWARLELLFAPTKFAYVVDFLKSRKNNPAVRWRLFYKQEGYDDGSDRMNAILRAQNIPFRVSVVGNTIAGSRSCRPLALVRWPVEGSVDFLIEEARRQLAQALPEHRHTFLDSPAFVRILSGRILDLYKERPTAQVSKLKLQNLFVSFVEEDSLAPEVSMEFERAHDLPHKNRQKVHERVSELLNEFRT